MILSLPEGLIAPASTPDHQPMPRDATRSGSTAMAGADRLDVVFRRERMMRPHCRGTEHDEQECRQPPFHTLVIHLELDCSPDDSFLARVGWRRIHCDCCDHGA